MDFQPAMGKRCPGDFALAQDVPCIQLPVGGALFALCHPAAAAQMGDGPSLLIVAFGSVNRRIELPSLDQVVEIAADGLAVHPELTGEFGDVGFRL